MSKAVMLSIQPKWCAKIASGEKTVEVRKTSPKIATPFKCYIYCTLSGSNEFFRDTLNGDVAAWNRGKWGERKGMVIGEFVCDKIKPETPTCLIVKEDRERATEGSCLTAQEIRDYLRGNQVSYDLYTLPGFYCWHISDLKIYDRPKALSEFKQFYRKCKYSDLGLAIPECWRCHGCQMERPPQSWCYVEGV